MIDWLNLVATLFCIIIYHGAVTVWLIWLVHGGLANGMRLNALTALPPCHGLGCGHQGQLGALPPCSGPSRVAGHGAGPMPPSVITIPTPIAPVILAPWLPSRPFPPGGPSPWLPRMLRRRHGPPGGRWLPIDHWVIFPVFIGSLLFLFDPNFS